MKGTLKSLESDLQQDVPAPADQAFANDKTTLQGEGPRLDVAQWLGDWGQVFREKRDDAKSRNLYHLETCPVHTDHDNHAYECCVMQRDDGELQAHCKHSEEYRWHHFKAAIGEPDSKHWIGRTRKSSLRIKDGDKTEGAGEKQGEEGDERGKKTGRVSQADQLIRLAFENTELFSNEVCEPHALIHIDGHDEILPCRGRLFKRFLSRLLYEAAEKGASSEALSTALNVIEAKAVFDGERYELFNRVGKHNGAFWYDLTDSLWRAVRVLPGHWQIVDAPPILFTRYGHHAPQVEPTKGGSVDRIFDFLAVPDGGPKLLMMVYLVSCFVPDIPHPIPVLHGPQGSGKSTCFRVVRKLVDPSAIEILSFPRDNNELVQRLAHHWLAPFDNVTSLQTWQSDALCRAVTGEGFSKRQLYSDDEDVIYSFRRCIGLNGINVAATRADLLDRSILVALERIPAGQRRTEAELWGEFEEARPHVLGGIFDALARAMEIHPTVELKSLPRMADFARWGCAISEALGYRQKDFLEAYGANIESQNEEVLLGHPVAAAVMALMDKHPEWKGTPSELLTKLEEVASQEKLDIKEKCWPKSPVTLTKRLNEVKTNLADAGVHIRQNRDGKARTIQVEKRSDSTVTAVTDTEKHRVMSDSIDDSKGDDAVLLSSRNPIDNKGDDGNDGNDGKTLPVREELGLLEGRI